MTQGNRSFQQDLQDLQQTVDICRQTIDVCCQTIDICCQIVDMNLGSAKTNQETDMDRSVADVFSSAVNKFRLAADNITNSLDSVSAEEASSIKPNLSILLSQPTGNKRSRRLAYSACRCRARTRIKSDIKLAQHSAVTLADIDRAYFNLMELVLDRSSADTTYRPLLAHLSSTSHYLLMLESD